MGKKLTLSILVFFISGVPIASGFGAGRSRGATLRDGFVLAGVDGKLVTAESGDRWFFEFDSDVSDGKGRIRAGASLELLPSAALQKNIADVKKRLALWGTVTKYKGKNFIFGTYFLPLSKPVEPESPISQKLQQQDSRPTINEPNDVLAIPQEILKKLKTRKIIRTEQLEEQLKLKTDCILADRTGFISSCVMRDASCEKKTQYAIRNTQYAIRNLALERSEGTQYGFFVLDTLGRGIQKISFPLLPCQALQRAQQQQSTEPELLRFKISGIVTEYKGQGSRFAGAQQYLLLQKATRVYSHGNFAR